MSNTLFFNFVYLYFNIYAYKIYVLIMGYAKLNCTIDYFLQINTLVYLF